MANKEYLKEKTELDVVLGENVTDDRKLILHNDDVHSFDYVIESLMSICKMNSIQAEQCTYLVHYKGKCDVKKGTFNYLKPFKDGLVDRELEVTIE